MNRLLDPNSSEKNDRYTLLAPSEFPDTYYQDADPMPHKDRRAPRASGPMDDLAPETLARVFAFLDPKTLGVCAGVCRTWNAILQLDTTWRTAFAVAFGLDEREESIAARVLAGDTACASLRVAPALRRLDASSWKAEYTARVALLRYVVRLTQTLAQVPHADHSLGSPHRDARCTGTVRVAPLCSFAVVRL